jgi:hypothetical protein
MKNYFYITLSPMNKQTITEFTCETILKASEAKGLKILVWNWNTGVSWIDTKHREAFWRQVSTTATLDEFMRMSQAERVEFIANHKQYESILNLIPRICGNADTDSEINHDLILKNVLPVLLKDDWIVIFQELRTLDNIRSLEEIQEQMNQVIKECKVDYLLRIVQAQKSAVPKYDFHNAVFIPNAFRPVHKGSIDIPFKAGATRSCDFFDITVNGKGLTVATILAGLDSCRNDVQWWIGFNSRREMIDRIVEFYKKSPTAPTAGLFLCGDLNIFPHFKTYFDDYLRKTGWSFNEVVDQDGDSSYTFSPTTGDPYIAGKQFTADTYPQDSLDYVMVLSDSIKIKSYTITPFKKIYSAYESSLRLSDHNPMVAVLAI